jgi:hypothetical protein
MLLLLSLHNVLLLQALQGKGLFGPLAALKV